MVADDAECLQQAVILAVFQRRQAFYGRDDWFKKVSIISAFYTLQHGNGSFQTHAGVHVPLRQRHKPALSGLVVLHEHIVPYFQVFAAIASWGAVRATGLLLAHDKHLGVRAAGPGLPGRAPPVVLLRQVEYPFAGKAAGSPNVRRFLILGRILIACEYRHGQLFLRYAQPLWRSQEFPAPADGIFLEIVSQRPVAQHLEESVVRGIAHFVDVYGADALLHIGEAGAAGMPLAQQIGYQRVHTRRGEKHCGIVLRNQGGRGYDGMALLREK